MYRESYARVTWLTMSTLTAKEEESRPTGGGRRDVTAKKENRPTAGGGMATTACLAQSTVGEFTACRTASFAIFSLHHVSSGDGTWVIMLR